MNPTTLELATAEELLNELLNRTTFAGVVIYSTEAHKFPGQYHSHIVLKSSLNEADTAKFTELGTQMISGEESQ